MQTFFRDDTEHGVEYVTKAEYQRLLDKHNALHLNAAKDRQALRRLILTHLVDDAAVAKERHEWTEIVTQLIACHDEPACPAVSLARAKLNT